MYRLVRFCRRFYPVFLFVLLEALAISYYAHATSYTRATLLANAERITGQVQSQLLAIGDYFSLRRDNMMLLERVAEMENRLAEYRAAMAVAGDTLRADSALSHYVFSTARIVSNSIARQDNYFIIDKGADDGVHENMAVLSVSGSVAGYVRSCSDKYSVCMSILNREFTIGGRLGDSEYFGSVYWDGTDARRVTMVDIPQYAEVVIGDTVRSVYSLRFPPDCFIGTVEDVSESADGAYYILGIRLGVRMNSLSHVLLVDYDDYRELEELAGSHFADGGTDGM